MPLARDVRERPPEFVDEGRIERGVLTVIAGPGGIGKGLLIARWSADVTTHQDHPATVWINSLAEDDLEKALKPRLVLAGADLDRVHITDTEYSLPGSVAQLGTDLGHYSPDALVLDSLQTHCASTSESVERKAMKGLADLAKSKHVAIIVIHHTIKNGGRIARGAIAGSASVQWRSRAVFILGPQPGKDPAARELRAIRASLLGEEEERDTHERLVLACAKMNNAPKAPSLSFALRTVDFAYPDGAIGTQACLEFVEEVGFTADQVAASIREGQNQDGDHGLVHDQAVWMLEVLAAAPLRGLPTRTIVDMAKSDALYTGERTWTRARELAGVRAVSPKSLSRFISGRDYDVLSDSDRGAWWMFV